ncbi:MAG: hypothetical protein DDT19_01133 [Syntrophomonadaceae bacterium]|nr:hypothetical protein [Bacillota bacterium]
MNPHITDNLGERWNDYWNKESIHTEQKYLTPDTHGIIMEFLTSYGEQEYMRGEAQGRLTAFGILHKKFMQSKDIQIFDVIEKLQKEILEAATNKPTPCTCASFFTVRGVHKEDCAISK